MSVDSTTAESAPGGIGVFEKWLSLWVALCIGVGLLLGNLVPGVFEVLAAWEVASVNLPVALLIWAMVYPMMVNVDFASLRHVGDRPKGLAITVIVNWLIKPFTMAGLAVLFFEIVFADLIGPADAQQYIAGLILLGAAPCTAMVFVWSQLTRGDPTYTLVQVSVNDVIMIFAFAPLVALLLGVTEIAVPWDTLLLSVGLYVVIPLVAGAITRQWLLSHRCAVADPVLRYLLRRLCRRLGLAGALQGGGTLRPYRHLELFRAGGGRGDQSLRAQLRRRLGDRGRRSGRGAGHAVPGRLRQSDPWRLSSRLASPIDAHQRPAVASARPCRHESGSRRHASKRSGATVAAGVGAEVRTHGAALHQLPDGAAFPWGSDGRDLWALAR